MGLIFKDGASLDIKLRPPLNIPKKSKKIYGDVYVRTLNKGLTHHLYWSDRLYICSLYRRSIDDVYEWINKNNSKIKERVGRCGSEIRPSLL